MLSSALDTLYYLFEIRFIFWGYHDPFVPLRYTRGVTGSFTISRFDKVDNGMPFLPLILLAPLRRALAQAPPRKEG